MPILLKFLSAHALGCIVFVFASIFPFASFRIHDRYVTHSEWWSSGIGAYVSMFGTLMAIAGYLLVSRQRFSRHVYTAVVLLGLVAPSLKLGEPVAAIFGVAVTLVVAAYLFLKASVKKYFASDKRL